VRKNQSIKKLHVKKFLYFVLIVVIGFVNLSMDSFSYTPSNNSLTLQQKEVKELVVYSELYTDISTGSYPEDSIITLNITVLPISNSSVFFKYCNLNVWDPQPMNYTLAPGESTGEIIYTLIKWYQDQVGSITYFTIATTENSNATIQWSYEVISLGKVSSIGFLFTFSIVGTIALVSVIFFKKRK